MKNKIVYPCPCCKKSHFVSKSNIYLDNEITINSGDKYEAFVKSGCGKNIFLDFARESDLQRGMVTDTRSALEAVKYALKRHIDSKEIISPEVVVSLYGYATDEKIELNDFFKNADAHPLYLEEFIVSMGPIALTHVSNEYLVKKIKENY